MKALVSRLLIASRYIGLAAVASSIHLGHSATPPPLDPEIAKLAAEVHGKGWIAYGARSPKGDWDLFVCRPDGSDVRPLTSTPDWSEFSPQFSRNGRKLLYRRIGPGEKLDNNRHGEQGQLVVANGDGSEPQVLGAPGEFPWASFNPEGTQIATLAIKGVSIVDLQTRKVVKTLPRKGFFQQTTWSPDGKWLCGVANSFGAAWSVARLNLLTGEASAINTVDCCTPDWFPQSDALIFSWRPPGQKANKGYGWTQLWRADVEGKTRQLVYGEDGRHVYGGNVSPDGQYVLFTGNLNEDGDPGNAGAPMGLMRIKDGPIIGGPSPALRALHPGAKSGPTLVLPAGWEPVWTFSDVGAVLSEPRETKATVPETSAPHSDAVSVLAVELHDQGLIAFSAKTERGDWDLFAMRPDGSDRRAITDTPGLNEAGVRFSPDGARILFYRMPVSEAIDNNNYGTFDLIIANRDGSQEVEYGRAYPWASWGPDGRQIACLTPKGIQIVDLASKKIVRQFARKGLVSQLGWSPDGKWFIGTANGLGQFWNIALVNPDTGDVKALSETERYNCTSDWMPDSRRVVYARGIIPQQPGRAELWVTGIGQERRRIYSEEDRNIYGACSSPDGRYVLFTRSVEDLGRASGTELAIIRWPSENEPAQTSSSPRLDLCPGWEPHWTAKH